MKKEKLLIFASIILLLAATVPEIKEMRWEDNYELEYFLARSYIYEGADEYTDCIRGTRKNHIVTVTVYNPTEEQCDSDPLITADGSYIDVNKLKAGEIKWCAVSRELRKKYPYGSEIVIWIDGEPVHYVVHDTMAKKWKNRVDLLETVSSGKWEGVFVTSNLELEREI